MVLGGTDLQDLFDSSFKQEESRSWVHVDFGTWHEFFRGNVTLRSNFRSQIDVDFGTQCWFLSFGLCSIFCSGLGISFSGANFGGGGVCPH